jgi:hypothetical protein
VLLLSASGQRHGPVVVAVVAVRVVQVPIHEVIDVVAMRDRRVSTAGAVHVVRIVTGALVLCATVRVFRCHFDRVFIVVTLVGAVQMPIVQIADVVAVPDGRVPAVGAMLVIVIFMNLVCHQAFLQFQQSVVTSGSA